MWEEVWEEVWEEGWEEGSGRLKAREEIEEIEGDRWWGSEGERENGRQPCGEARDIRCWAARVRAPTAHMSSPKNRNPK